MNFGKITSIVIGVIVALAALMLFVFLMAQDLVWSGQLVVATDFKEFTPYFSILKPQGLIDINGTPKVLGNPIYFDLSLSRDFKSAKLEIEYKDDYNYKIKIGPNIGADWELKTPSVGLPAPDNGYKISSVEYDLTGKNINKGKLRFMISIPGLSADKPIFIKRATMTLERKPLLQEGLINNLLNYFDYAKVQFGR